RSETKNVAADHAAIVQQLTKAVIVWHKSMPEDNGANLVGKPNRKKKK
ncbi:MAG: hypothetical protein ACI9HK_005823, partial [Pirellulaceae bacterium]